MPLLHFCHCADTTFHNILQNEDGAIILKFGMGETPIEIPRETIAVEIGAAVVRAIPRDSLYRLLCPASTLQPHISLPRIPVFSLPAQADMPGGFLSKPKHGIGADGKKGPWWLYYSSVALC